MDLNIKFISPLVGAVLIFIGIFIFWGNVGMVGNFILLGFVISVVPFFLISYFEYQKMKSMEDQLPAFLLDLAETQKTGMTLPKALKNLEKTDYGKLSEEIKKMNDQLSWGVPLQRVLGLFAKRMEKSDMIRRVIRIINDAYSSGGDIARTMEAVATDMLAVKEAEKERKSMMFQHVIVMYSIYFIFVGIIIGLSKTLIPMLEINVETAALGGLLSFQDPCTVCTEMTHIFCTSCSVFNVTCQMFDLGVGSKCYYNALFLLMAMVQGIFTGLVAGQIGENSVIAGLKHSLIMTTSGFAIILILLQTGII
jgi:flagellar protein FlaJ